MKFFSQKIFFLSLLLLTFLTIFFFKPIVSSLWNSHGNDLNLYLYEARAFLNGKLDLPDYHFDAAIYQGKTYVPYPPFPALLLMPFVFLLGIHHVNILMFSLFLSLIVLYMMTKLITKEGLSSNKVLWILIAFFWGSPYWSALKNSNGVWFFAHIVSMTTLSLALYEAKFRGRPWLTGLYLVMSVLSRQMVVYAFPLLLVLLFENARNRDQKPLCTVAFTCTFSLGILFLLMLNWLRFDHPLEMGYRFIPLASFYKERVDQFGLFNIKYVPFNFVHYFLQGLHFEFSGPDLLVPKGISPFGTAVTFSTPYLMIAFWADWSKKALWAAWLCIGVTILHQLFYYANGFFQIHTYRFSCDFLPIMILLVASGTKYVQESVWKALIAYSLVFVIIAHVLQKWANSV